MKSNFFPQFILLAFIGIIMATQTSCMGMMMMGGHDSHNEHAAVKVTKEVTNGDYTLAVSIDPMTVGKEGNIAISFRSKSSVPESIGVHYMITKSSETGGSTGHDHSGNAASKDEFKTIHHNIVMVNGTSTVLFTPTVAGSFVLSVEVEIIQNSDSSFSVETTFMTHEKKSGGMMGMGGMMGISSEYWFLGTLAMAGMMVIMVMARGGIN
jgi:hypothetical protein